MTTCVIVGAIVVSCLIDPATRPTPEEAARVARPVESHARRHAYVRRERPRHLRSDRSERAQTDRAATVGRQPAFGAEGGLRHPIPLDAVDVGDSPLGSAKIIAGIYARKSTAQTGVADESKIRRAPNRRCSRL